MLVFLRDAEEKKGRGSEGKGDCLRLPRRPPFLISAALKLTTRFRTMPPTWTYLMRIRAEVCGKIGCSNGGSGREKERGMRYR